MSSVIKIGSLDMGETIYVRRTSPRLSLLPCLPQGKRCRPCSCWASTVVVMVTGCVGCEVGAEEQWVLD